MYTNYSYNNCSTPKKNLPKITNINHVKRQSKSSYCNILSFCVRTSDRVFTLAFCFPSIPNLINKTLPGKLTKRQTYCPTFPCGNRSFPRRLNQFFSWLLDIRQ